ncbi:MAG: hypothetical protein ABI640_12845 [Gammaproteobacteria bacterium]
MEGKGQTKELAYQRRAAEAAEKSHRQRQLSSADAIKESQLAYWRQLVDTVGKMESGRAEESHAVVRIGWISAGIAAGALVAAVFSGLATYKALDEARAGTRLTEQAVAAARDATDAMEAQTVAETRPWVSADVVASSYLSLGHRTGLHDGTLEFSAEFRNFGKSLATHVRAAVRLIHHELDAPDIVGEIRKATRETCETIETDGEDGEDSDSRWYLREIFPSDKVDLPGIAMLDLPAPLPVKTPSGTFTVSLVGCVRYEDTVAKKDSKRNGEPVSNKHMTAFAYRVLEGTICTVAVTKEHLDELRDYGFDVDTSKKVCLWREGDLGIHAY